MRARVPTIAALLAALVAGAGAAEAQFDVKPPDRKPPRVLTGKFQISGFVGMQTIDQELGTATNLYQSVRGEAENISFGKLFGVRASWGIRRNLHAEFNFSRGENAYSLSVNDDEIGSVALGEQFNVTHINLGGNIVLEIPRGAFVPYITGGAGMLRTSPNNAISGVEDVSTFDFNVGGGLKYWFSTPNWLGIRVDARYHSASDGINFPGGSSSPKGLEFTVGAAFKIL